jgi:uridine phosphorylase
MTSFISRWAYWPSVSVFFGLITEYQTPQDPCNLESTVHTALVSGKSSDLSITSTTVESGSSFYVQGRQHEEETKEEFKPLMEESIEKLVSRDDSRRPLRRRKNHQVP